MIDSILGWLIHTVTIVIGAMGYSGVLLLMIFESCGVPFPSEVIMPFAGFLVVTGEFNLWVVALVGTLGNLIGSLVAYYIGLKGGRPLIEKYGRYILISKHDLDKADGWFSRYGDGAVLIGRLLPVVRTYISFPAGVARMNVRTFSLYTALGAFPWCLLFAWLGIKLKNNWELIHEKLHNLDLVFVLLIIAAVAWYIARHIKQKRTKIV